VTAPDPAGLPTPPQGLPQQRYPVAPTRRRGWGPVVAGLIVGLVLGGGGVAIAWVLTTGATGVDADADAVCDIVERTGDPPDMRDMSLEYMRRWAGVGELGASLAEGDASYKPLADALEKVSLAIRAFDVDEMRAAIQESRQRCADL
jgi:hypothetical protein